MAVSDFLPTCLVKFTSINVTKGGYELVSQTTGTQPQCKHENGWYDTINFLAFWKKVFLCTDCETVVDIDIKVEDNYEFFELLEIKVLLDTWLVVKNED